MGQTNWSNDAARKDAQFMLSKEECAGSMVQMSNSLNAAKKNAQTMLSMEERALGIGRATIKQDRLPLASLAAQTTVAAPNVARIKFTAVEECAKNTAQKQLCRNSGQGSNYAGTQNDQ
jgi:hypothetical protein